TIRGAENLLRVLFDQPREAGRAPATSQLVLQSSQESGTTPVFDADEAMAPLYSSPVWPHGRVADSVAARVGGGRSWVRSRRRRYDPVPLNHAVADLAEAVHRQWSDEAAVRILYRPQPLNLQWATTARPVASPPAAVLGGSAVGGRPIGIHLRGRLDDIVDTFLQLPRRQLVVLGEPGSGKTVLAILFTLGLLEHRRQHGGPVPVLLSLSSWDPRAEHLHTWLATRLIREYPALANISVFGRGAALRLVCDGKILPVLDGLDEMPTML